MTQESRTLKNTTLGADDRFRGVYGPRNTKEPGMVYENPRMGVNIPASLFGCSREPLRRITSRHNSVALLQFVNLGFFIEDFIGDFTGILLAKSPNLLVQLNDSLRVTSLLHQRAVIRPVKRVHRIVKV